MKYPSIEEYTDALSQGLGDVLLDPALSAGQIRRGGSGLPLARSGGFALTYELLVDGRRYALRCFHRSTEESLGPRYAAIRRHLRRIRSSHFVPFEFLEEGIRTESGVYPVMWMEWAEGESLASYVYRHRRDPAKLHSLRAALNELAAHLAVHELAHGDLQPGNMLIDQRGQIRLIDYDGLFVPELRGMQSLQLGHENFQHPARGAQHFDERLDFFAFCALDLALRSLSQRPSLWDATASDCETFLFRASDFLDPAGSGVFRLLRGMTEVRRWSESLAAICLSSYEATPSLEEFLAGKNIPHPDPAAAAAIATRPGRPAPSVVAVPAADFARCCACVGERVELVGRVVQVAEAPASGAAPPHLRIDFGAAPEDMVCLSVEPGIFSQPDEVPGQSWTGQWVSAIGLVEPISSGGAGAERSKVLSLEITEAAQLRRLTLEQVRERLGQKPGPAAERVTDGSGYARGTIPAAAAAPRPAAVAVPPAPAETVRRTEPASTVIRSAPQPAAARTQVRSPGLQTAQVPSEDEPETLPVARTVARPPPQRRPRPRRMWWAATALASLAAAIWLLSGPERMQEPVHRNGPGAGPGVSAGTPQPSPGGPPQPVAEPRPAAPISARAPELQSEARLDSGSSRLSAAAGHLEVIEDPARPDLKLLQLGGRTVPGLAGRQIELAHRAEFSDREVVVGFTDCDASGGDCGWRRPFWLVLRPDSEPILRLTGARVSSGGGAVTALDTGVHVELGIWDGDRRTALLTYLNDVYLTRVPAPGRPLDRQGCRTVIGAMERCAASRDCGTLSGSASRLTEAQRTELRRLYHETTGLDIQAFGALCQRSCELGLTPSRGFVRANACNGSPRGQWAAGSLDWLAAD
jgi:hypothetical protein